MKKIPLSVAIITKNEENNLKKLLPIISEFADEIVIIDSFSEDNSKNIAATYNCNFIQYKWLGYAEQKNLALSHCKNEWILSLDADELPDNQLIEQIINIIQRNEIKSFKVKRYTHYLEKLMNYAWQPDIHLRLVHKSLEPRWVGGEVHEKLIANGNSNVINGKLIHYSYSSIQHHFQKTILYSELGANKLIRIGKKPKILNLIINPAYAFFNMYFLKLGLLDGWRGLVASFSSMTGTFLKYAIFFSKIKKM